jgi:hypothetical protein
MQEADIEGVAQAVAVRQHARETIKAALQKGWQVHILSVNWSAALIRAVLAGIPSRIDREGADSLSLDSSDQHAVVIHANNLEMQFGISTGLPPAPGLATLIALTSLWLLQGSMLISTTFLNCCACVVGAFFLFAV